MKKGLMIFILSGLIFAGDTHTIEIKNGFTVTYLMLEKQHIAIPTDQAYEDNNTSDSKIQHDGGDIGKE